MDPELNFDEKLVYDYRKMGYDFRSVGIDTHAFTQPRYNMIIDLSSQDEDEILNHFHQKVDTILENQSEQELKLFAKQMKKALIFFMNLQK